MAKRPSEGFPPAHRIVRSSEYRAIYEQGQKLHSHSFVLFGRPNALGYHRLGVTVSRKVGGAVARNRAKRLFREVFRRSRSLIPRHFDLVVNVKRECRAATFQELRSEFLRATLRFVERAASRGERAGDRSDERRDSVPPAGV